jgi:multiple sugar transport system substrate-binding protein
VKRLARRDFLAVLTGGAAATLIAACSQPAAAPAGKPAETKPAAPAAEKAPAAPAKAEAKPAEKAAEKAAPPEALKIAGANALFWFNQPLQYEAFKGIIDRFHSRQDKVKMDVVLIAQTDIPTKLATAIAGGEPPDAVRLGGAAQNALFINNGHAAALDDWDPKIGTYDWLPGAQKAVTRDGKMMAVPVNSGVQAFVYNTDLYQKVGLDPANLPKTLDQVLTNCEKIATAGGGELWGHFLPTAPNYQTGADFFIAYLWSYGGRDISEDGKTVMLDSPETAEALQWYKSLVDKKGLAAKQMNETQVLNDFLTGNVGSFSTFPATVARVTQAPFKTASAPLPAGPKGSKSPLGFGSIMVLKNAKNREGGWAFASFIGLEASNAAFWNTSFGQLPARYSFREDPSWKEFEQKNPLIPPYVEQQKLAEIGYYGPGAQEIGTEMGKAVEAVVFGQKTPKQAAEDAAKASQIILERELKKG